MESTSPRTLLVAVWLVVVSLLVAVPAVAGSSESSGVPRATPLVVKITSKDSKRRIKVARDLKTLISCSKSCRANVRIRLKTPINKLNVSGTQLLDAGDVWTTGIRLTPFGLRYLKKNYRKSTLKVAVTATDRETGKKVSKTRFFRFYR